jgi:hypothetical protein
MEEPKDYGENAQGYFEVPWIRCVICDEAFFVRDQEGMDLAKKIKDEKLSEDFNHLVSMHLTSSTLQHEGCTAFETTGHYGSTLIDGGGERWFVVMHDRCLALHVLQGKILRCKDTPTPNE